MNHDRMNPSLLKVNKTIEIEDSLEVPTRRKLSDNQINEIITSRKPSEDSNPAARSRRVLSRSNMSSQGNQG
jgi:ribosomal 50S subunit-recycling heat shock protein